MDNGQWSNNNSKWGILLQKFKKAYSLQSIVVWPRTELQNKIRPSGHESPVRNGLVLVLFYLYLFYLFIFVFFNSFSCSMTAPPSQLASRKTQSFPIPHTPPPPTRGVSERRKQLLAI